MFKLHKKRYKLSLIGCVFLVTLLVILSSTLSNIKISSAVTSTEFLLANGKTLTYRGTPVVLRGVNFDNINALGAGIGTNNVNDIEFDESDYQKLVSYGANHARFGLSYTWWASNPTLFYQKLDQQVAWAHKYGVWLTLLTFINPDGTSSGCYEGYGNSCNIWTNATYQQQLQNFWLDVAAHYKDEPAVAGYDLINEPTPPGPNWCRTWFDLAQKIRNAVTDVAPNQLIFISACSDPTFDRVFKEKDGTTKAKNVIYEVHDYDPLSLSSPGYNAANTSATYPGYANVWTNQGQINLYFDKSTFEGTRYPGIYSTAEDYSVNWANSNNVPLYVGEWGAQSFLNGYALYVSDKGAIINELKLSHAFYTWKHDVNGSWRWGMFSRDGLSVDQPKVNSVLPSLAGSVIPNFDSAIPTSTASSLPSATPKPGDSNGDNKVDGVDYVVWLNHYSQNVSGVNNGDFNGDNKVDGIDYIIWLNNYSGFTATPTPSPTIAPTGSLNYPRNLVSTNSNITLYEKQAPSEGKVYIGTNVASSINIVYMAWYIDGGWKTQDNNTPWEMGNGSGYTLTSGIHEVRAVACLDSVCSNWVDSKTTYVMP